MTMMNRAALFAVTLLALFAPPSFGYTHYSQGISSSTSSLSITSGSHGIFSQHIAVVVRDGSTVRGTSGYSYSVDGNYTVALTFSPAVTSGTVDLYGPLDCCTNASTDWQVTIPGVAQVEVCAACSSGSPAIRDTNSHVYTASNPATANLATTATALKVYILDNRVVFGLASSSGSESCTGAPCRVDHGISGYPSGSVSLGHVFYNGDGTFGSLTDDRPAALK